MTDRELMQQALGTLEKLNKDGWILADFEDEVYASIEALRARLAEQKEPDWSAAGFGKSQPKQEQTRSQKMRDAGITRRPKGWDKDGDDTEQEPVAWMSQGGDVSRSRRYFEEMGFADLIPLYPAPPQREWIGLTDEELREFEIWLDDEEEKHGWNPPADIVKYMETKLKEKNHG